MKVLVLLSLVALCYSRSTFTQHYVNVKEDGTLTLGGLNGGVLEIHRSIVHPNGIVFDLTKPDAPLMHVEVDHYINSYDVHHPALDQVSMYFHKIGKEVTQYNVLHHLFLQFEGPLDEMNYYSLLEKVHFLVHFGVLHKSVDDLFKVFDDVSDVYGPHVSPVENKWQEVENTIVHPYEHSGQKEMHPWIKFFDQYEHPYEHYEVNPWSKFFEQYQHSYEQNELHPWTKFVDQHPHPVDIYENKPWTTFTKQYQHPLMQHKVAPWMTFSEFKPKTESFEQYQHPYTQSEHGWNVEGNYLDQEWYPHQEWYPQQQWYPHQEWYPHQVGNQVVHPEPHMGPMHHVY